MRWNLGGQNCILGSTTYNRWTAGFFTEQLQLIRWEHDNQNALETKFERQRAGGDDLRFSIDSNCWQLWQQIQGIPQRGRTLKRGNHAAL
jgi:hypothetical protein